jgi:glycerol-3-phosphate O-acyltransferase/dihydroxyacetone phosphate acyltransferase
VRLFPSPHSFSTFSPFPPFPVPVARAQDYAYNGKGIITLSPDDPLILIGSGTKFTEDFAKSRTQILLPRNLGSVTAEVVEVVSDTQLKLKKEFAKKAMEGLKAKPDGVAFKVRLLFVHILLFR